MKSRTTSQYSWQDELRNLITGVGELASFLELDPTQLQKLAADTEFPLRVTRSFVDRMRKGDPNDPLLLQIFPGKQELEFVAGYATDPLQENKANPVPGLLHKYRDRVLLTLTGACAINCRYCFRRHFPYAENTQGNWTEMLTYINNNPAIKEVILSGGDPLITKDQPLKNLLEKIAAISHVTRLRIHSRLPIVLPSRITDNFIAVLNSTRLKAVMIVHANHANEINDEVIEAVKRLQIAGITTFNQAVLLKNINDSTTALVNLSEALFSANIIPYYLHLLDKVQGAAHFDVNEETAKKLLQEMTKQLPGYLVPKLVKEQAGAASKTLIPL